MLIAALVTAMFVVPIVVAWWFALIQPPDNGAGMLNRGMLIAPPLDINADAAMTPLTTVPLEPGEWAMMNFSQNACDPVCEEALKKLATIHAVLGHDGALGEIRGLGSVSPLDATLRNQIHSADGCER